jgi:RNA polymerase sigma factor (sigma-70 family)
VREKRTPKERSKLIEHALVPDADLDAYDVALAAEGDEGAFERLYRRHVTRIYGLARRMAGPDDADELTQDAFVRAWQKIAQFRGEAAFGSWLYRVAISVILGHRRRLAIHRERMAPEEWGREGRPSHERSSEIGMDFDTAIERLPPRARRVFVLHDVEGYKHHEIARMLKITAGTSKSQLHRARMLLRATLA